MSFEDRLEVPAAKSRASTRATFIPANAASRAIADPFTPPPMTARSNFVFESTSGSRFIETAPSRARIYHRFGGWSLREDFVLRQEIVQVCSRGGCSFKYSDEPSTIKNNYGQACGGRTRA